jgi:hypothetical protein
VKEREKFGWEDYRKAVGEKEELKNKEYEKIMKRKK